MSKSRVSRFLSYVLRHKPEKIGLTLDENGWASVSELLNKLETKEGKLTMEQLKEVVETNNKQRFAFNEDETKIRANQGHSIDVDLNLTPHMPPDILYHGTAMKNVGLIIRDGINKGSRQFVHLSTTRETAEDVGARHGTPYVISIAARLMCVEGRYSFYLSENGVWMTEHVPAKYLINL